MTYVAAIYSTGSLALSTTQNGVDGKPLRGIGALGGKKALAGPSGSSIESTYKMDVSNIGINHLWNNIAKSDNFDLAPTYRCIYVQAVDGSIYSPEISINETQYASYSIKICDIKNIECGIVIPNEYVEPIDPNASAWIDVSYSNRHALIPSESFLESGDFIYVWIRRTPKYAIGNAIQDKMSLNLYGSV
jgi:hypothetical protein